MIIIGITGSIGMGKSTIASMLNIFNIPVYDADYEVKKLIENNNLVIEKIKKEWPSVINLKEGKEVVDKIQLGELVFRKIRHKLKLERIIHPLIHKHRDKFFKKYKEKKTIIALDVPLLYEADVNKTCNYIFLALTSEENQKLRVLKRPNMTEEKFILIKKNQWSDEMKKQQNPYIITTSYGKLLTFLVITFYLLIIIFKEKIIKI
jgi:dephospho-CoA kinase